MAAGVARSRCAVVMEKERAGSSLDDAVRPLSTRFVVPVQRLEGFSLITISVESRDVRQLTAGLPRRGAPCAALDVKNAQVWKNCHKSEICI